MRKSRSQRGMSLLELSAASIVVAVSLLGTTAAVISGATLSSEVTRMRAATRAATTIMEEVRSTDFAEIVTNFDRTTVAVGGHETGIDDGTATISVVQVDNGSTTQILYEVTVNVTFEGSGGTQSYPIVTYVSDRVAGNSMSSSTTLPPGNVSDPNDPAYDPTDPNYDPTQDPTGGQGY